MIIAVANKGFQTTEYLYTCENVLRQTRVEKTLERAKVKNVLYNP